MIQCSHERKAEGNYADFAADKRVTLFYALAPVYGQITDDKDRQISEGNRRLSEYASRIWFFGIGGCLFAILFVVFFSLYCRKQKAYRNLIYKNLQWAGVEVMNNSNETPTDKQEFTSIASSLMDITIMGEVQKLVENGLYKDHYLTVESLANKINYHHNYVSNAINHCMGKNFKTYINEFRVKEAIRIFSDNKSAGLSIDEVAFNSGFNERTNFYRAFKKITGLSPTAFRNK